MNDAIGSTSELEHRIGRTGRLSLSVPAGSITIRATDDDVVRIRDVGRNRPLAERFTIEAGTDHLALRPVIRLGFLDQLRGKNGDDTLEVDVPRSATVAIETASADIDAVGLSGPKRFKTASGDLALRDVGGDLEVDAVSGDVSVDANDRVEARIRTISGDLRLRAPALGQLDAGTTSGDIRLDAELSGSGPFSVKSISGDMTIVSRGSFSVEAQTITGDLVTSLEHRLSSAPGRRTLVIGRDGPTLQFKSVSGDLLIVEARDDAAPRVAPDTGPEAATGVERPVETRAGDAPEGTSWSADRQGQPDDIAAARLGILRALERGELTVEAATDRLAELEAPVG